ncbi:uncharacterized protein [Diadema setosum]|uniref:uncharacterized protein n=1 Tax=Diadema setosum TaxID=31175 RepID=UPI003B3B42E9
MAPNLDPMQFGKRKNLSTSHCIINVLHNIYVNAEKSKSSSTLGVTNFTKAFDRIDHTTAITKLVQMGVRPCMIPWIVSFLSGRQQCVRYRGSLSNWASLNAGGMPLWE